MNRNENQGGAPAAASARGEATRERLVAEATRLFILRGFHGVSTRELSRIAKVNLAAINYHFGGKQGLYDTVLERVLDEIRHMAEPIMSQSRRKLDAAASHEDLARVAGGFVRGLVQATTELESPRWTAFLLDREFLEPSGVFGRIYNELLTDIYLFLEELTARATGKSQDDPETKMRSHAVLEVGILYSRGRDTLHSRLGMEELDPENKALFTRTVISSACRILCLPEEPALEGS
jgi:AcrR family transcriptional regulator